LLNVVTVRKREGNVKIVTNMRKLKKISAEVNIHKTNVFTLESHLKQTLKAHGGLGLSAIQIGVELRVFVMQLNDGNLLTVVNPQIVEAYDFAVFRAEGCLSLPGRRITTNRPRFIKAEYSTSLGERKISVFTGLEAVIFQHEYDHLDGITMLDRKISVSSIQKNVSKVGRNDPCPCGSGKKYKKCCLNKSGV